MNRLILNPKNQIEVYARCDDEMNDEFYIGWEDKAPPGVGSRVRRAVVFLLALGVALGVVLSLAQRTIGVSVFEWGKVKSFSGILQEPALSAPARAASRSE